MKKILCILLFTFSVLLSYGQNTSQGVLKFMDIPIDGTESQFASQLQKKGFRYNYSSESYKGQFNGQMVDVYIHTNHELVDRVYVAFPFTEEAEIKNEYNRLLAQFASNSKYMDFVGNEEIPSDESVSYEITVNSKRYQASFSYLDPDRDPVSMTNDLLDTFVGFIPQEAIDKLKKTAKESEGLSLEEKQAATEKAMTELGVLNVSTEADPERSLHFFARLMQGMSSIADGDVWFMIHKNGSRYNLGLYYDNLHNRPHGEDL